MSKANSPGNAADSLRVKRFSTAGRFLGATLDFLLRAEAENNLMLGLCSTLIQNPESVKSKPYFAVAATESGTVLGAALMIPENPLVLSAGPPEAIQRIAENLATLNPTVPSVLGPKAAAQVFASAWADRNSIRFSTGLLQRIYRLQTLKRVTPSPGRMRKAWLEEVDLLLKWSHDFVEESNLDEDPEETDYVTRKFVQDGRLYVWEDEGEPVSMAGFSGNTPNGVRVCMVYTPPPLRGQGFALSCVAALSRQLLQSGKRECFLFTDLSNPTSNRLYQRIGYEPVSDFDEYKFHP